MPDDSRKYFCSKDNRDNSIKYLSMLSDADLNSLKKFINKEIAKRKIKSISDNGLNTESTKISSIKNIKGISKDLSAKISRIDQLLSQDWSHLFPSKNTENKYYVYFHVDPTLYCKQFSEKFGCATGVPFYVGKGSGNRAYDLKRNQGHGATIRQLLDKGYDHESIVVIPYADLTEAQALEIESKLIYLFGSIYERGRKNSCLLNIEIPARPL